MMSNAVPTNQAERRRWLIEYLVEEGKDRLDLRGADQYWESEEGEKMLLRALFNVRPPEPATPEFYEIQDAYLQEEIRTHGITDAAALPELKPGIALWQGDITTLACDAIVNAANEYMLGCFIPNHRCIDNAIHTFAGVQLRLECAQIMQKQGHPEPTGKAKITGAYNLPSQRILHTVGPIIQRSVTEKDRWLLHSCYDACLDLAWDNGVRRVAFCCISTGEFHFPNVLAAEIAVAAVQEWRQRHEDMHVVFNVFKDEDRLIYEDVLK